MQFNFYDNEDEKIIVNIMIIRIWHDKNMNIRIWHDNASEMHNLNNPRQTECSLRIDNQLRNSVSERLDILQMPIVNNHF